VNNVTFAQLMVASILLAVLAVHRWPGRRGRTLMVVLFFAVVVLDGAPMFGADVGGVLGGITALAVTAGLLWGIRIGARHVGAALALTAVAVVTFGLIDLAASSSQQSHLGRLFERVGAQGSSGFTTVVARKWDAAVRSLTASVWRFVPLPVLLLVGSVAARRPEVVRRLHRRLPELRAGVIGIGVAAVLGFALNDSGVAVPGMIVTMLTPAIVFIAVRFERSDEVLDVRELRDELVAPVG
jgi:hypothetical protein